MQLTFAPRNILQFDDVEIIWPNFSGTPDKYNRDGKRSFNIVIPDEETKEALEAEGWTVKTKPANDEYTEPLYYMPVKVSYHRDPELQHLDPVVTLVTGRRSNELDEESIDNLDHINILEIPHMDISPYDWEVNGKTGRSAYLKKAIIVQEVDRYHDYLAGRENPQE